MGLFAILMNTNATNKILQQVTNVLVEKPFKPANQRQAIWYMITKPIFDFVEINGVSKGWVMVVLLVIITIIGNIIISHIGSKDVKPDKRDIFLSVFSIGLIIFGIAMAIYDQIRRFSK